MATVGDFHPVIAAERILVAALADAGAADNHVTVTTAPVQGHPAEVLMQQAERAELLVIGTRGHGRIVGALLGSVSQYLAAHATCPVVVVRDSSAEHPRGEPGPAAGQVVVGVDDPDLSSLAVDFAFAHAALHGMGVIAVHAHQRTAVRAPGASRLDATDARHEVRARMLTDALAGYRDKYPGVPVQEKQVHGRPAAVLVAEAAGAALTVVGSRGRGGFAGLLLGSTSQAVLHHASSPVAIVRAHRPAAPPPPEPGQARRTRGTGRQ
jgi:nucleotide-binding universal stress UspA family protein